MSAPEQRLTADDLISAVTGILDAENDTIANMANISAMLYEALPNVNWVGFYILRDGELVLGPFQGRVACTRIPLGKGVCGTAAHTRITQRVDDVHAFPGHIACDVASVSEIVVPIVAGDALIGVLDLDSPVPARFSATEQALVEKIVAIFAASLR